MDFIFLSTSTDQSIHIPLSRHAAVSHSGVLRRLLATTTIMTTTTTTKTLEIPIDINREVLRHLVLTMEKMATYPNEHVRKLVTKDGPLPLEFTTCILSLSLKNDENDEILLSWLVDCLLAADLLDMELLRTLIQKMIAQRISTVHTFDDPWKRLSKHERGLLAETWYGAMIAAYKE